MDYEKICALIARYRPLSAVASLPFVSHSDKGREITWFNYTITQDAEMVMFSVNSIYSYIENENKLYCERKKLIIKSFLNKYTEPEISEQDYFDQIMKYPVPDIALQCKLLSKAEMLPIVTVYKEIMKYKGLI